MTKHANKSDPALKRKCRYCEKLFVPEREWQKFCCREHQKEYWKRVQNDKVFLLKRIEQIEEANRQLVEKVNKEMLEPLNKE